MFDGMHDGWMWGLHWLWWVFWLLLIAGLGWAITRSLQRGSSAPPPDSQGGGTSQSRETPLETLQRRYAEGELSTEEYEQRKERLERDL